MTKKDIKNFTFEDLKAEMTKISEPPYRAEQIFSWLYKKGVQKISKMSNLGKPLKDKLEHHFSIHELKLTEHLKAQDGAEKFLFELQDGNFIETVLIPASGRKTVCISSQVGCKFGCSFCATGGIGFKRNLTASEMINQILFLQFKLKHKLTNYVFMGMGEPLDNFDNLKTALNIMNSPKGMGIAARRITVSTCGIVPKIEEFKKLGLQANLSLSLHAANDRLRDRLIPINKKYPLEDLIKASENYLKATNRQITLEYVIIKNVNDSATDAEGLAEIARRLKATVNLIPFSSISKTELGIPDTKDVRSFIKQLEKKKVNVTLRESKGKDINAACGQLAGRKKNEI